MHQNPLCCLLKDLIEKILFLNPSLTLPVEAEVEDPDQVSQVVRPVVLQEVDLLRLLLDDDRVVSNEGDLVGQDDDLQSLRVEEILCKKRPIRAEYISYESDQT